MKYKIRNINYYDNNYLNMFYNKIYFLKKDRISKYKQKEKFASSVIGEIILSELLKENYNINYCDVTIAINNYGKPFIKEYPIFHNISHSHNYVITAISNKEIGIDIEKIRTTSLNCIKYFATYKEQLYILSSNENLEKRIFEIYSLKEAYFKMKGTNLDEIKNVEFTIANNIVICSDKNVSAYLKNDIEDYIIAICEKNA